MLSSSPDDSPRMVPGLVPKMTVGDSAHQRVVYAKAQASVHGDDHEDLNFKFKKIDQGHNFFAVRRRFRV